MPLSSNEMKLFVGCDFFNYWLVPQLLVSNPVKTPWIRFCLSFINSGRPEYLTRYLVWRSEPATPQTWWSENFTTVLTQPCFHCKAGGASSKLQLCSSQKPTTLLLVCRFVFKEGGKVPSTVLCPSSWAYDLCKELINKIKERAGIIIIYLINMIETVQRTRT